MMTSTFEDSVLDFDINLFQQSSNNAVVQTNKDKVRKAIFISKRKMMSTDSLIRKFYDKRLGCRALERSLLTSKEEYKQACIESMEYRERCAVLEEEIKKLQISNAELEEKCIAADNRYDGMQSHAKQLQQLVKENETEIESLKIEHKLEKANSKEQEKKFTNLQRENEHLIKNICSIKDIVLGKKKLTKELKLFLTKYGTSDADDVCDSAEHSCDEADSFHTPMSPLSDSGVCSEGVLTTSTEIQNKIGAKLEGIDIIEEDTHIRDDNDQDSECSNEVVSLDTGRGSSLAFSDSDKCFNSPEYYSRHSPLSAEVIRNKEKVCVDIATSPISIRQLTNTATSPVQFEIAERLGEVQEKTPSHTMTNCSCENNKASGCIPTVMIDRVVSPIMVCHSVEASTSPVKDIVKNVAVGTSPLKLGHTKSDCSNNDSYHIIQEKECLELNNSNCLQDENSSDSEIQMILNTMRFSEKLITPIPTTPAKSRTVQVTANCATQTILHTTVCPDAAKIREENTTLQATVAKLANDISNINNFLHKLNPFINNEALMDTGGTSFILNDGITETKKTIIQHDQKLGDILAQKKQTPNETASRIEKLDHKGTESKLKRINSLLFADSSPPSPCDDFLLPPSQRTSASLLKPTLSPSTSPLPPASPLPPVSPLPTASSPPPASPPLASPPASPPLPASPPPPPSSASPASPTSPASPASPEHPASPVPPGTSPLPASSQPPASPPLPPASPPLPPASPPLPPASPPLPPASPRPPESPPRLSVKNDSVSFDDEYDDENEVKSKERLQFEESLSNQGILSDDQMSDYDVYEHEIVIELAPDCLESDTNSLHEILKEQVSKDRETSEKTDVKRTPKSRKVTKLEKLRKKMMPKSKIKNVDIPTKRKGRVQPKRLKSCKERLKSDNFINNKAAYEKACKVMAEIKSKEKADNKTLVISKLPISPEKNAQKIFHTELSTISNQTQEKKLIRHKSVVYNELKETTLEKSPPQSNKNTISTTVCLIENDISNKCQNVHDIQKAGSISFKGHQRTVRTRSLSKSNSTDQSDDNNVSLIQNLEENDLGCHNTEVARLDKLHLQPHQSPTQARPTLKMYSRNRDKIKGGDNFTIRHSSNDFVKPHLPTVTEEIIRSNDVLQSSEGRKRLKRPSVDKPDLAPKRMLRSSTAPHADSEVTHHESESLTEKAQSSTDENKKILSYEDLDIFDESPVTERQKSNPVLSTVKIDVARRAEHPKFGILCAFLDKYGGKSAKTSGAKLSENTVNAICKKLEDGIAEIQKLPPKDTKQAMDTLVKDLQSWKQLQLLSGLMKYLKDPARKIELFNKVNVPPAPPMTKAEQILIYIVSQLKVCWPDIVNNILRNIEYSLFMLNRTPEFDVIETLSHFYAVLCRYDKNRNRLRLFIIDAMYCLQYKAVPLIRQCLDVWMHILPLAHMGIAKNPLVTCLVYLLHFYKCEDKFNRVQDIRNILNRKYFYEMSEWNETRILEMFRSSIIELRDIAVEKKMLRMALIVLAKRHGARWCQNYIVKNMLQPIIEQAGVPERVKHFCVSLLGPLLKPYPMEMKINCEIVMNQLFDMLNRNPSKQMEEAIFTSLVYMSRHNQNRVIRALLFWKPGCVSLEFEDLLRNYIKERPIKSWKTVLSKISLQQS